MASTAPATESYPSPITPRDSESESLPATDPMASRKRSASEIEDSQDQQPRKKHSPSESETGRMSADSPKLEAVPKPKKKKTTAPNRKLKRGDTAAPAEPQETIEAEANVDTTFTVECPVLPGSRRYQGRLSRENLYTEQDAPPLPNVSHLTVDFAVKPGSEWSKLKRFKNAKFKDPVEVVYSAGQIVYVNRHLPVPPAPPTDLSDDEKLAYDRENFWVALIAEFRAASQEKVYVRLFWLYWPEELPMGRQPYHGKQELVMSNHVDVVEAQSIACHTNISHWDEKDDSNKVVLSERYWRQTYDLTKLASAPQRALSRLRRFCICRGHDNPGLDMYQCHKIGCGMWNHQACLITNFEDRAWGNFKKGELGHEVEDEPMTFTPKVADTVGQIVEKSVGETEIKDKGTQIQDVARWDNMGMGSRKAKLAAARKQPWSGKLEGAITKIQKSPDDTTHRASVTQLVPTSNSKPRASFSPTTWNMELKCLRCQHPLN